MAPLIPISNGRDGRGRFTGGHSFAKGNRFPRRMTRLKAALLKAVTPDDVAEIARSLVAEAKAGDVSAAKLVFDHVLGKPVQAIEVAEVKADDEEKQLQEFEKICREMPLEDLVKLREHQEALAALLEPHQTNNLDGEQSCT